MSQATSEMRAFQKEQNTFVCRLKAAATSILIISHMLLTGTRLWPAAPRFLRPRRTCYRIQHVTTNSNDALLLPKNEHQLKPPTKKRARRELAQPNMTPKYWEETIINLPLPTKTNVQESRQLTSLLQKHMLTDHEILRDTDTCVSYVDKALKRLQTSSTQLLIVEPFGSSCSGLCFKDSDIDLHITSPSSIDFKRIERALNRSRNIKVQSVIRFARCPVIKVLVAGSIYCDIIINRPLGICNSLLLREFAACDERAKQLMMLVKLWAKRNHVADAFEHTLSSYTWVILAICFLRRAHDYDCHTSILPNLLNPSPEMMEKGPYINTIVDGFNVQFAYALSSINSTSRPAANFATLSQLFHAFFDFLMDYDKLKVNHEGYPIISLRSPAQLKNGEPCAFRSSRRDHQQRWRIEDPFELTHDLGSPLSKSGASKIRHAIEQTRHILQQNDHDIRHCFGLK